MQRVAKGKKVPTADKRENVSKLLAMLYGSETRCLRENYMVILRRTERSTVASKGCFESNFWTCRTQRIGWVCWVYNIGWMSWKEQMGSVDMGMF